MELSTGRGGSGNIRRVKSTKEITSRPLASPKMLELEPPRNRVRAYPIPNSGSLPTSLSRLHTAVEEALVISGLM